MSRQKLAQRKPISYTATLPVQRSIFKQRSFSHVADTVDTSSPEQSNLVQRKGLDLTTINLFPSEESQLQTKLSVGAPGDKYEQEADTTANKVMTMSEPSVQRDMAPQEEEIQAKPLAAGITPLVQREMAEGEEKKDEEIQTKLLNSSIQREALPEEEKKDEEIQTKLLNSSIQREALPEEEKKDEEIQTKLLNSSIQREALPEEEEVQAKPASQGNFQASNNIESQLSASKGGGSGLADDVRGYMEPRFGADFSSVKVHTDSTAVQMNKELGAQAFTHGNDIYYGAGKSPGKDELTAHELTHVVQQNGAVRPKELQKKNHI